MTTILSTSKGDVSIRLANQGDAAALLELRLEALTNDPVAFAADADMTAENGVQAWVERLTDFEQNGSGAIIIATMGDRLVGMAGIGRGHWPKTRHAGTIWGVYVTPAWRGQKVGQGIVNGCLAWASENGLSVATLGVVTTNISAIRCYESCGFTQYGIQPRVTYCEGKYYDDVLMAKLL